MACKLYVGNLPYGVRDHDLQQSFAPFGTVVSAKVILERDTGRSKGFGFVEMGNAAEAKAALEGMHGQALGGRSLLVNEAHTMEPRTPRTDGYGVNYAGRNEGSFRSPYGTGPRHRNPSGADQGHSGARNFCNQDASSKGIKGISQPFIK